MLDILPGLCYYNNRKRKDTSQTRKEKTMKFYGYWVGNVCYGCTAKAKERAEKAAAEQGLTVYRATYKV